MPVGNPYESPNSEVANADVATSCPAWFDTVMFVSAIVTAFGTIAALLWGAEQEPFYGAFSLTDAMLMLVGGGIGLAIWTVWSLATLVAVKRQWWSPATLLLLLIAISFGYVNYCSIVEYVGDRMEWSGSQQEG